MSALFNNDAQSKAAEAQARAAESQAQAEQATKNMQANFATDLNKENVGSVVAGGSADVAATEAELLKKKRNAGVSTLSSSLGLNL